MLRTFTKVVAVGGLFFGALGAVAGFILEFAMMHLLKTIKGRRIRTELAGLSALNVGATPIVYLRGFSDDKALGSAIPINARSLEEGLCLALSEPSKRVVALGKPG